MDKYEKKVLDKLKEFDLTVDDLTKAEYNEMLEEAKLLDDDEYCILDGWFDMPSPLYNIQMMKRLKECGVNLPKQ